MNTIQGGVGMLFIAFTLAMVVFLIVKGQTAQGDVYKRQQQQQSLGVWGSFCLQNRHWEVNLWTKSKSVDMTI